MRYRRWRNGRGRGLLALALTVLLGALTLGTLGLLNAPAAHAQNAQSAQSVAPARPLHALLVRSEPKADAILAAPPSQVKAWFSEPVNPFSSELVVIDPTNHEVDTHDSHVSSSDASELIVNLQLLRPGTYIVVWRTQSTIDGHVVGGNFLFRIANADGSVPPIPSTLPTARIPGGAGYGAASSSGIDGPTAAQALFTWLAFLFLTFWVGGVFWETWVAPVSAATDVITWDGARLASQRFRRLMPYVLVGLLVADVGLAAALTDEVAGSLRGLVTPQFWRATLFSGQFGIYWWMRQGVAVAALLLALVVRRPTARLASAASSADSPTDPSTGFLVDAPVAAEQMVEGAVLNWTRELGATLRQVPRLPRRLLRGWLALPVTGQIEVALAFLALFAFAMSGHAAAAPPSERAYAVGVDLFHLIFESAWLGGLFYISVVLVPAAKGLSERARALLLAHGVPAFSAIAIVSATLIALTGSLNTTVRLTSAEQFITTAYGRVLTVKIEFFLIMVIISAWHAFHLRPRLAFALSSASSSFTRDGLALNVPLALGATIAVTGHGDEHGEATDVHAGASAVPSPSSRASISYRAVVLAGQMENWLRREALLGAAVLLCVALLAIFSGTLSPAQASVPASSGAYTATHTVQGYHIQLNVDPASFGTNTFTVTVTDPQGKSANGAAVLIITNMLDMDMGQQSTQLKSTGASSPGVYTGTSDLTMAGHWEVIVKVLPSGAPNYLSTQFKLLAGS